MVCDYHDSYHDTNNQMDRLRPCAYDSGIGTKESQMSYVLPDPASRSGWGFFGYWGAMCDQAIRADNAPMLEELLNRGVFKPDDEMLSFKTVRQFCKEIAPNCYAMLQAKAPA
jgi:hypothetical protein